MKRANTMIFTQALRLVASTNVDEGRAHLAHLDESEESDELRKAFEEITKGIV